MEYNSVLLIKQSDRCLKTFQSTLKLVEFTIQQNNAYILYAVKMEMSVIIGSTDFLHHYYMNRRGEMSRQ